MTTFGEQLDMLRPPAPDRNRPVVPRSPVPAPYVAPTGQKRKEQALIDHEEHKGEAIRWLRKEMAKLYLERVRDNPSASVSAEDARAAYLASNFPQEYSQTLAFMGAVFRGNDWEFTGERFRSQHPANHARELKQWRYVGEQK